MVIVRASSLSRAEMRHLGNNVLPAVIGERRSRIDQAQLDAVNRSLAVHGESIDAASTPCLGLRNQVSTLLVC